MDKDKLDNSIDKLVKNIQELEDDNNENKSFKEYYKPGRYSGNSELNGRLFSIFSKLNNEDMDTIDDLAWNIQFNIQPATNYTNFDILIQIQKSLTTHKLADIIDRLYSEWVVTDEVIPIYYETSKAGVYCKGINEEMCKLKILSTIIHCITIWIYDECNQDAYILVDIGMIIQNFASQYYKTAYEYVMCYIKDEALFNIKDAIENKGYSKGDPSYNYVKFGDVTIINKAFEIYTRALASSNFDKFTITINIEAFYEYSMLLLND